MEIIIESIDKDHKEKRLFPSKMTLILEQADMKAYLARISDYSFMATMVIILSFFTMLGVIK